MVTQAMEPLLTRVLPRGNWQDESGAIVAPAVPEFLARQAASEASGGSPGSTWRAGSSRRKTR